MRLVRGVTGLGRPPRRAVVTVGVFDGVHRAHQQLIGAAVRMARRRRGTSVVITFNPDPQTVVDPSHTHPALMPLEARLVHLARLGVDWVWLIPFTKRFSRLTARQFIQRMLINRLRATTVILGERFVFGRNRRGDMEMLRSLGPVHGMQVLSLRQITSGGRAISSSRIRQLISHGQLASAKRLLGRPPSLYGTVVRGAGRGRRLGFRTANIRLASEVSPPPGVYAVRLHDSANRRGRRGVMNLGVRPTFGPGPRVCEVHLLGFSGRLLGRSVSVCLLARLRGERCFPSPQALIRQVRRDIARARRIFSRTAGSVLLAAATTVMMSAPASADFIRLKNGNVMEGEVRSSTEREIVVHIPGLGEMIFSPDEVASIEEAPMQVNRAALGEPVSRMSYRIMGGPSLDGIAEMGVSIEEFSHRVTVREFRLPIDETPGNPDIFFDRTATIPADEYHQYWELLPVILEGRDVWSLTSDPAPASMEGIPTIEAAFQRHGNAVVYRTYGTTALAADSPMRRITQFLSSMAASAHAPK